MHPFQNAKVVGEGVDPVAYHRQSSPRGSLGFSMSRSSLCRFFECPQRWLLGEEEEETESTIWGKNLDAYLLGGRDRFAITPEFYVNGKGESKSWNWNGGECKEWKKDHEDKLIVKSQDWPKIESAGTRLIGDPLAGELIRCSKYQVMVVGEYHDRATGIVVPVKCLIDLVPNVKHPEYGKDLADLKTADSAQPSSWLWKVRDYNYHVQAAMSLDLYTAATGEDRCSFRHVISEKNTPYQPGCELLSVELVSVGRQKMLSALRWYCWCLKNSTWPNYAGMAPANEVLRDWHICQPNERMMMESVGFSEPPEDEAVARAVEEEKFDLMP